MTVMPNGHIDSFILAGGWDGTPMFYGGGRKQTAESFMKFIYYR